MPGIVELRGKLPWFEQESTKIWDEQNPVSRCLLFATLFDLFLLSRKIALVGIQILGKIDPKNISSVPQQVRGDHLLDVLHLQRRDVGWIVELCESAQLAANLA